MEGGKGGERWTKGKIRERDGDRQREKKIEPQRNIETETGKDIERRR